LGLAQPGVYFNITGRNALLTRVNWTNRLLRKLKFRYPRYLKL